MPTGDSLTIATVLFGSVLTCVVGAIAAPPGWRANVLWGLTILFAIIGLGWLFPPTQSPFLQALMSVAVASAQSGALVMLGTVGVVALMVGKDRMVTTGPRIGPPEIMSSAQQLPEFADSVADQNGRWSADTSFVEAMLYLHRKTRWGLNKERPPQEISAKLREALSHSRLSAWGKVHPDDEVAYLIRKAFWTDVDITLESDAVFSKTLNVTAYDVRLCQRQLEAAWPPQIEDEQP